MHFYKAIFSRGGDYNTPLQFCTTPYRIVPSFSSSCHRCPLQLLVGDKACRGLPCWWRVAKRSQTPWFAWQAQPALLLSLLALVALWTPPAAGTAWHTQPCAPGNAVILTGSLWPGNRNSRTMVGPFSLFFTQGADCLSVSTQLDCSPKHIKPYATHLASLPTISSFLWATTVRPGCWYHLHILSHQTPVHTARTAILAFLFNLHLTKQVIPLKMAQVVYRVYTWRWHTNLFRRGYCMHHVAQLTQRHRGWTFRPQAHAPVGPYHSKQ